MSEQAQTISSSVNISDAANSVKSFFQSQGSNLLSLYKKGFNSVNITEAQELVLWVTAEKLGTEKGKMLDSAKSEHHADMLEYFKEIEKEKSAKGFKLLQRYQGTFSGDDVASMKTTFLGNADLAKGNYTLYLDSYTKEGAKNATDFIELLKKA